MDKQAKTYAYVITYRNYKYFYPIACYWISSTKDLGGD